MYGTQTSTSRGTPHFWFENDVKMYGTQTSGVPLVLASRLRMM